MIRIAPSLLAADYLKIYAALGAMLLFCFAVLGRLISNINISKAHRKFHHLLLCLNGRRMREAILLNFHLTVNTTKRNLYGLIQRFI